MINIKNIKYDLVKLIQNASKFPYPSMCRHLVALDLVELLEKYKLLPENVIYELAKQLSAGSEQDEKVQTITKKILKNKH